MRFSKVIRVSFGLPRHPDAAHSFSAACQMRLERSVGTPPPQRIWNGPRRASKVSRSESSIY
jgi:hypothetical protein